MINVLLESVDEVGRNKLKVKNEKLKILAESNLELPSAKYKQTFTQKRVTFFKKKIYIQW